MKESLRKFGFNLFLLALILTTLGYGLFLFLIPESYFPMFPFVPFFLFVVTMIVHIYLVRASENDSRKFASKYLGSMGLKLFIYILFLTVVLVLDTKHAVPFLVSFLVCYAAFTLVEVIAILKHQKRT
ncbi:hypothetical protein ACFLTA_03795 [Bacteroidota bacterium]